jgi:hypothetical protein
MKLPRLSTGRAAAVIVLVVVGLAFQSSIGDSPIVDEVPHIGAGYSYVARQDMRLNPEHPPLVKDLAGLPIALFLRPSDEIFGTTNWTTAVNGQWNFGRELIFRDGENGDTVKTLARAPLLIFLILSCWLIWKWTRERYGGSGALMAVVLFAFSPTVLAHARLVTTDMAAAFGVLASTYCFLRYLREPNRRTFALAALTLGIAFLSKFNTVLLGPFFVLVACFFTLDGHWESVKRFKRALRAVGMTALIGATAVLLVVWPVYIVHTLHYPAERQLSDTRTILASQEDTKPLKRITLALVERPVLRSLGHWTLGLAMVVQRNAGGNTIYWLGRIVKEGGPWYFPIVYLLKEPLAWWALCALAVTTLALHRRRHQGAPKHGSWWTTHTEEWMWLLWLAIYWGVSINSTLNIGIRHLMPVYPFTAMFVAGRLSVLMEWLRGYDKLRFKWFAAGIAALLGWYVFSTVHVHPYYLTYFNEIAGGPRGGFRYVVDSNLDWGQDAKRLAQWTDQQDLQRICVDYFGWADIGWYMGDKARWVSNNTWRDAQDFIRRNRCDGWFAVSATYLQNSNGERTFQPDPGAGQGTYRWLLDYQPVTVVGNSIFIYHITK